VGDVSFFEIRNSHKKKVTNLAQKNNDNTKTQAIMRLTATTTCKVIGVGILLTLLCLVTVFPVRRAEGGFKEQRTNKIHRNMNTTSQEGDRVNNGHIDTTVSSSSGSARALYFDLNATMADTYVRDSIGADVMNTNANTYNPLEKCSVTTHFRLVIPTKSASDQSLPSDQSLSPTIASDPWILQTFDSQGVKKTVGGDEMYIIWKASTGDQAVAWAHDRRDGTYELEFVQPPMKKHKNKLSGSSSLSPVVAKEGKIKLFYDYSCGVGSLAPPLKENFTRAGEVQMLLVQKGVPRPPIREFREPNQENDHDNTSIDLSRYDFVYFFGDSMIQQLARRFQKNLYWNDKIFYKENVAQSLTTVRDVETMLQKLRDWHGSNLTSLTSSSRIAVVTESSLWEILRGHVDPGYKRHVAACRSFVTQFRAEYPVVDLYWKSPSALHFHKLRLLRKDKDALLRERARYMSQALPYTMYELQKSLMHELGVPFLDLYEAYFLSGPWTRTNFDARHFRDEISALLLSYYWRGLDMTGSYERLSG
jgi:hypothetical protein